MALRNLTADAMVHLSAAWLDPKRERPLLESHLLLAGLIASLETAHSALLVFDVSSPEMGEKEQQIVNLAAALTKLDRDHDRIARGFYKLLDGLAELSNDSASRFALLELRDALLPLGLREAQRSYLEQSENLHRIREQVLPKFADLLRTIPLPEGDNLGHAVERWTLLGIGFDRVDSDRRKLQRELDALVPSGNLNEARLAWVRTVNAMLVNAVLAPVNQSEDRRLFDALREAEAKADRHPPSDGHTPPERR